MNPIIGRLCQARYQNCYIIGKLVKHDFKSGIVTIETKKLGTIKAKAARITFLDKEFD